MLQLQKWYLDIVDEHGAAAILYWARISMGPVGFGRAALLRADEHGIRTIESARCGAPPTVDQGVVRWAHRGLGVCGVWRSAVPGCQRELAPPDAPRVEWACHAPRAEVELRIGERTLRGLGYAERLALTVVPWRLQLDELRWGRVVTQRFGATWIEWRGETPMRVLLVDGVEPARTPEELAALRIDDCGVAWSGGRIEFFESRLLRDSPLIEGALANAGLLARLAPKRILLAHESKWLSRSTIAVAGAAVESGWAIHEVVRFGNSARGETGGEAKGEASGESATAVAGTSR